MVQCHADFVHFLPNGELFVQNIFNPKRSMATMVCKDCFHFKTCAFDLGEALRSHNNLLTSTLTGYLLVSAIFWYLEFHKLSRAFPRIFSWSDPSFWAFYMRAVILQIAYIPIKNPNHIAMMSKSIHQKSGPAIQLFRLHNYKTDLIVNQDTNPLEQNLRATATRFAANRVRERFSVACQIFQDLVQKTAQQGQPLKNSVASALFEHSNKILFDYEPSNFTSTDITELIDFLNFDNLDGIGILQTFFPATYKLPLSRNKRRNAIIEKFEPLFEDILKQQKNLVEQGQDCLLRLALNKIEDDDTRARIEEDDDYLKAFFWGLYTASFLTSITTSCVVLHYLAKHKDTQDIIASEIKYVFPEEIKEWNHSHLMKLVHTRSFVREVMRYFSPAPSLGRRVGRINLNLSLKALNESPDLWEEPKTLIPDRFVKKSRLDSSSHKFFPFGIGRRSCPGQEYVQFESVLIVALFIRKYKITHEDPDTKLHLSYSGSIPTIMNPSDLVFDFYPRDILMNRRSGLMKKKSTASFMAPGERPKIFSGVARFNGILMGTLEEES